MTGPVVLQAFENVGKVPSAASASFGDVVELEIWFTESMADLNAFHAVRGRYFTTRYPTWTGFAMPGILVEIKCMAILGLADA